MNQCFLVAILLQAPSVDADYQLPKSTSELGKYSQNVESEVEVTRHIEVEETREYWCYDPCRRCWYKVNVIEKVRKPVKEARTVTKTIMTAIPPIRGQRGAESAYRRIKVDAPSSAGVIADRVYAKFNELFDENSYDLVRTGESADVLDVRSRSTKNNLRIQVICDIDANDPRTVRITTFAIDGRGAAAAQTAAQVGLALTVKAIVD